MSSLTELIWQVGAGNREACDALFTAAYAELRKLARSRLRDVNAGHEALLRQKPPEIAHVSGSLGNPRLERQDLTYRKSWIARMTTHRTAICHEKPLKLLDMMVAV